MPPEPFRLEFGMKGATEADVDGEHGLVLEGYASLFGIKDSQKQTLRKGAFESLAEDWGHEDNRRLQYQHGFDPNLGTRTIGHATDYRVDDTGLYVKAFIPEHKADGWSAGAKAAFKRMYDGIKAGAIRGFSVAGVFLQRGDDLFKLAMNELSVTPRPSLAEARFVAGQKAMDDYYGEDGDMMPAMTGGGVLTPPNFAGVMKIAQGDNDHALHDHLLRRPAEFQSGHDGADCPICAGRRVAMGMKAEDAAAPPSPQTPLAEDPRFVAGSALVAEYVAGAKAGRTFSAASTAQITRVIEMLQQLIAQERAEDKPA